MTLDDKIALLSGTGFETRANERLGIPALKMADGPMGVHLLGKKTSLFPSSILMAATFDPALVHDGARAIAREAKAEGRNMLLAPYVNLARIPHSGRNFESYGEDPFLISQMAAGYVKGIQREGVIATVKHFALNNQELDRTTVDVRVDERTMHETELPGFHAAVKAGAWSVMSAYNSINGTHATENKALLTDLLKKKWRYRGFVVSDWNALKSTVGSALGGTDLEMPAELHYGQRLKQAVLERQVPEATVDEMARRVLRPMFALDLFAEGKDGEGERAVAAPADVERHRRIALKAAQEGIVLLKNERSVLPLTIDGPRRLRRIAMIGPNAKDARPQGGGSAQIDPLFSVSPLEGLTDRLKAKGASTEVVYALGTRAPMDVRRIGKEDLRAAVDGSEGLHAEYFDNGDLQGQPVFSRTDEEINFQWFKGSLDPRLEGRPFSVRWSGRIAPKVSGRYTFHAASIGGMRLYVNGRELDDWQEHGYKDNDELHLDLEAGKTYELKAEYRQVGTSGYAQLGWEAPPASDIPAAVAAAKRSDVAVVVVGFEGRSETEGEDRRHLELPPDQVELIEKVAAVNPNTVVVVQTGGPVVMSSWQHKVAGIMQAWYPGEEGGHALADLLLGNANPSGRLPMTFPARADDVSSAKYYPGKDGKVEYADGIHVGYRHFDRHQLTPQFAFGFGLSYTTFAYADLGAKVKRASVKAPRVEVEVSVTNSGARAGAEVIQLYVAKPGSRVERAPRELKGFARVELEPGQVERVRIPLDKSAFAYYDEATHRFEVEPGEYQIWAGSSSRDLHLATSVVLQ
jgi:beta-glucosidase